MSLFNKIPENIFSILASKNKRIYTDALFVIREAFKIHMTIRRDDLVSMLIAAMEDEILSLQYEEDESIQDLSTRAYFMIRRLDEVGWIHVEFKGDTFESIITLPDYAITLINVLFDLSQDQKREYNALVVTTYNNLKMADQQRDDFVYTALDGAYQATMTLLDLLKSLYNNISRYHQQLLGITEVNDILSSHFDDFKLAVMDQFYHPLKTFDSVPRFKRPILNILTAWQQDQHLKEMMVEQAMNYSVYKEVTEANAGILNKINFMLETYEGVSEVIKEIDYKNSLYTQATIEKIQYLVNRDSSIKGKLVDIVKKLGDDIDMETVNPFVSVYHQQYADHTSVYARSKTKRTKMKSPLKVAMLSEHDKNSVSETFAKTIQTAYSQERIKDFIMNLLEKGEVTSADMPLEVVDDLIKMMMGALQSGRLDMPFEVEFQNEWIENDGCKVPMMIFRKKGL